MLLLGIGGALVVITLTLLSLKSASRATDLGTMSHRWVSSYNASRH